MFLIIHSAKLLNSAYICIMKSGLFHFKRFSVSHCRSSMKVGVDGVLIGAWATGGSRVLDVGTGCGVIALMMAQRYPEAIVDAIDIDISSVKEAADNFAASPWGVRLRAVHDSYSGFIEHKCRDKTNGELSEREREDCSEYDLIVSNPPYFDSGVTDFSSARTVARHQGSLSPEILISEACGILSPDGKVSMIVPSEFMGRICDCSRRCGLSLHRSCLVKAHESAQSKRIMLEFGRALPEHEAVETLVMFDKDGFPTPEYKTLCGEFYLRF